MSGVAAGLPWRTAAVLVGVAVVAAIPKTDRRTAVEVAPQSAAERALALELSVDVWTEHITAHEPVVVVLAPSSIVALAALGIPHRTVVDDIDAVVEQERMRLAGRAASGWFDEFRDLAEVNEHLHSLVARYPDKASVYTIGTSIEGQRIRELRISRGGTRHVAITGGQHAREWISVMVPVCVAERLLLNDGTDPRVRELLAQVTFHIVPVVNPDGYAYSWTHDRYWRKNRRGGFGVDLNRNFSVGWGTGSSNDRSSGNYRGEHAFSEPETRAVHALFDHHSIDAHIDFHSYSQVVLYPWSYQKKPPGDRDRLAAIADRMATALYAAHGERYRVMPGADLSSAIGGTIGDWAYESGALSFLVELRPASGDDGGFVLPPEQIAPTCDEAYAAVLELARAAI